MKISHIILLNLLIIFNTINLTAQDIISDFKKDKDLKNWFIVNDDVMGGISESDLSISKNGDGVFQGYISTENNGGFCSLRQSLSRKYIGKKTILKLKIKGDGKDYQLRIKADRNDYFSYIETFKTTGEWEEINIPLREMYPSFRGRKLNMQNFNNNYFEEIAFLVGNKKNEKFKLIIDRITLE
ncbi:CIA30 family protein [Flavobacteriales bacterium]|nr:CIA30 family protein [Flavobacteriales bacterium]